MKRETPQAIDRKIISDLQKKTHAVPGTDLPGFLNRVGRQRNTLFTARRLGEVLLVTGVDDFADALDRFQGAQPGQVFVHACLEFGHRHEGRGF